MWREVKVVRFARLNKCGTLTGQGFTRLHQRRLVAVLGDIDALKPCLQLEAIRQGILCLQLEAIRQGITTAPQVAWISDGARGFWRLY